MTDTQLSHFIFIALLKTVSDYSATEIGKNKHKTKHDFNVMVKNIDNFIKTIETSLNAEDLETLESLNTEIHNFIMEVRKVANVKK